MAINLSAKTVMHNSLEMTGGKNKPDEANRLPKGVITVKGLVVNVERYIELKIKQIESVTEFVSCYQQLEQAVTQLSFALNEPLKKRAAATKNITRLTSKRGKSVQLQPLERKDARKRNHQHTGIVKP